MIYALRHPETGLVKLGTTTNYHMRLSQLITEHGDLELLGIMEGSKQEERALHERFAHLRANELPGREWFYFTGELSSFIYESMSFDEPKSDVPILVKIKPFTMIALKLFQARQLGKTGKNLTADDAILFLLWQTDRQSVIDALESIGVVDAEGYIQDIFEKASGGTAE